MRRAYNHRREYAPRESRRDCAVTEVAPRLPGSLGRIRRSETTEREIRARWRVERKERTARAVSRPGGGGGLIPSRYRLVVCSRPLTRSRKLYDILRYVVAVILSARVPLPASLSLFFSHSSNTTGKISPRLAYPAYECANEVKRGDTFSGS